MKTSEIVKELGGTSAVAQYCGIAPAAVSQWSRKDRIPKGWLRLFQREFPELFQSRPRPTEEPAHE